MHPLSILLCLMYNVHWLTLYYSWHFFYPVFYHQLWWVLSDVTQSCVCFLDIFLYFSFSISHFSLLFPPFPSCTLTSTFPLSPLSLTHTHTLKHTHAHKHTAGLSEWAPVTLWINHSKRFLNNAATSPDARCVYVCVCVCVCVWRWSHIYCSCSHSNSVYDLPKVSIKIKEHRLCRTHSHTCLYPMTCPFRWTGWCWLWGRSFIITQQEDRLINTHAHAHSRLFNQSQTVHQSGVF